MLELLSEFTPGDLQESECCVEFDVVALSETCIQREYGKVCFTSEVLREKAKNLIGKPVLLDHEWRVEKVVGVVMDAHYDEKKKAIVARLRIPKEGHEKLVSLIKLSPSPIKNVSVGAIMKSKKENGAFVIKDIEFKELSLVFEGADKNAKRMSASGNDETEIEKLGVQNWWEDPELRSKAPTDYFLDPIRKRYPYKKWNGEILPERLKVAMSLAALHGDSRIYSRAKALLKNHCGGNK